MAAAVSSMPPVLAGPGSSLSARALLQLDDEASSSADEAAPKLAARSDNANQVHAKAKHAEHNRTKDPRKAMSPVDAIDLTEDDRGGASPAPAAAHSAASSTSSDSAAAELRRQKRKEKKKRKRDEKAAAAAATTPASGRASEPEDEDAVTSTPRPSKLQRTAASPTAPLSLSPSSSPSSSPTGSDPSSVDDDVDLVGLGRELGLDLTSASTPLAVTPAPRRTGLGFEILEGGDGAPSGKKGAKVVRRYFDGEDISTKCYNCGLVGHQSTECSNPTVFKPCWLCGLRGHAAHRCTRELCFRCMKEGHQSRDCTNPRVSIQCCFWCASTHHSHTECTGKVSVDLSQIRCYVCGCLGHLNCASSSSSSSSGGSSSSAPAPLSCSNCGLLGHVESECGEERMPLQLSVDNYGHVGGGGTPHKRGGATPRAEWMAEMECFYCRKKGHQKMNCPRKAEDEKKFGTGGFRRRSNGAPHSASYRNNHDDRRYSDFRQAHSSSARAHSATPFSRQAGRQREQQQQQQQRARESTRERERDFLHDRAFDRERRASNGGGKPGSRPREGRSRERDAGARKRDARSAPPAKHGR